MTKQILKIVTFEEEFLIEGFPAAKGSWHLFTDCAAAGNPWVGAGFRDLVPTVHATLSLLGEGLSSRTVDTAGAMGEHPHHRIGSGDQGKQKYGHDLGSPAAV